MKRELLLLRHGKSDWAVGVDDYHRPLKKRGRRSVRKIGEWLQHQELKPDWVVCSSAERALTTAVRCCKVMGITEDAIHTERRIYMAYFTDLLAVLSDLPATASRVLLVGHNPGLEELLSYLVAGKLTIPPDGKLLPTATLARLQMPDDWSALQRGDAAVSLILRPGEIEE
ncbi:MAG: histidine phosphatase family protein [Sedimenticola sp.]